VYVSLRYRFKSGRCVQKPIGLRGLIGESGLMSKVALGGVRSCTTVNVVFTAEAVS
jgi:hypothetical protein